MPSLTTLLEDTSPLLVYSQANWQAGTSNGDALFDKYSDASFTLSQTKGSTMSFGFNGTSISVYGAKRGNHGQYNVTVDNFEPTTGSGASDTETFQQLLYSSGNLRPDYHNLTLLNVDGRFLDVDFITFTTSVGRDDEDMIINTFQNGHPAFSYNPSSSWKTPSQVERFMGGSGHATTESATMTFTFQRVDQAINIGDAIALYGPVGPSAASYTVQIDDGSTMLYAANRVIYRSQQVLYFASNLGTGIHTLQVQTSSASGEFAVDYATVYTTKSLGGSLLTNPAVPVGNSSTTPGEARVLYKTPVIVIIGLAGVSAILLFMILGCIFLTVRLRRTRRSMDKLLRVGVLDPELETTVQPFPVEYHSVGSSQSLLPRSGTPSSGITHVMQGTSTDNVNGGFTTVELTAPGRALVREAKFPNGHTPNPSIASSSLSHLAAPPRYQPMDPR